MTRSENLNGFIEAAKHQGASDEFVVSLLREHGWPSKEIYAAFGARYATLTGLAVPERSGGAASARDAFLYLLTFCTLGTWATALGSLFFAFIDRSFPDPVMRQTFQDSRSSISSQMASIIVAFPIFLFVTRFILRQTRQNPEMLESGVRKWLTYIALLITAGIVIGDLITFLAYFLRGELTARFVLKVATVLCIAGVIFAYYLASLRSPLSDVGE